MSDKHNLTKMIFPCHYDLRDYGTLVPIEVTKTKSMEELGIQGTFELVVVLGKTRIAFVPKNKGCIDQHKEEVD